MAVEQRERRLGRYQVAAVSALLAAMLVQAVYLCWARGIWIDEIWSLWMGRRDLPFREVVTERWLRDVHPPMFSAINWIFDPLVGLDIAARRLINLAPLAAFVAGAVFIARRNAQLAKVTLVYGALLAANTYVFVNFAEHRPYFLMLSGYGLALLSLYAIATSDRDLDGRKDLPLALVCAASLFVAFNTHFVCAVVEAPPVGLVLLDLMRRGRWRWSAWIAGALAVSGAFLVAAFYFQYAYVGPTASTLWIDTGMRKGLILLTRATRYCLTANLVATAVAAYAAWRAVRPREGHAESAALPDGSLSFVLALGLGMTVACAAELALNAVKPIIEYRYFAPFAPVAALAVAILAARRLLESRLLITAFVLNGLLFGAFYTHREARNLRWFATARYIQAEVQRCPTTRIYGVDPRYVVPYSGAKDHDRVQAWGYQIVGRMFGFEVQPIDKDAPLAIRLDARCPTLFWAEHMYEASAPAQVRAAAFGRDLPAGRRLSAAELHRGKSGFVLSLAPAAPSGDAPAPQ